MLLYRIVQLSENRAGRAHVGGVVYTCKFSVSLLTFVQRVHLRLHKKLGLGLLHCARGDEERRTSPGELELHTCNIFSGPSTAPLIAVLQFLIQ